ncbi:uncharacterized protein PGTG_18798 [Puccinia graminis f. sp. tritici CRL 75-36-700-3]|uniref:Large ribosomal subunit protein mL54 n=1 Tax=Puccinia graminis f. sp. tritici (strain CRL 75-36-700-3 / race SCCL) TaxID=418459 RepID=E3L8K5_PUCGT|nr:uncharacterized protein PGTG_18798 [Puccinia graminis f. sp. tritici CRL 75-36-700-3]EFP92880.1 hypothetical protein PGTG_18798 [Puccinia graminis f. sp. tritici CRL 75-36-700-3]
MSSLIRTGLLRLSSHTESKQIYSRATSNLGDRHLASQPTQEKKTSQAKKTVPVSTIPAGSPIKGLAYIKGESDPIAKADDEYPSWLWTLLEPNMGVGHSDTPLRAIRRELNRENRNNIRKSNFLKAKK